MPAKTNLSNDLESIRKSINDLCDRYQKHLRIDPYNLSRDCAEQPEIYFAVVSGYSEIYCFIHRLKLQSNNVRSIAGLKIRKAPDTYGTPDVKGVKKLTESLVNELVNTDVEVASLEELLVEANVLNILAKGLLDALEHRRSMLNNEVQLSLSSIGGAVGNKKIENYAKDLENKNDGKSPLQRSERSSGEAKNLTPELSRRTLRPVGDK